MKTDSQGWIKVHRSLAHHEIWLEEPFTRGQAWLDMLLLANHKDGTIRVRGIKIKIKRGQLGWSELGLSKRWLWSRGKVRKFLDELKSDGMIDYKTDNKTMVITLLNYSKYQERDKEKRQQNDNRMTTEWQQNDTNKNGKNGENGNNNTGDSDEQPEVRKGKPSKCTDEDWNRYLDKSEQFLEWRQSELGKMVKITEATIRSGAKALDNLIRVQGYDEETVLENIRWGARDSFWGTQIRSLGSLTKSGSNGDTKYVNMCAARLREVRDAS